MDPIAYKPYTDPDDFIREVTDLIWVHRSIGHIYDNYEPEAVVHGAYGTSVGVEEVVAGTLMRIAATPDRVGQADALKANGADVVVQDLAELLA